MEQKQERVQLGKILVRGLPAETRFRLEALAELNERSVEGEARYAIKSYVESYSGAKAAGSPLGGVASTFDTLKRQEEKLVKIRDSFARKIGFGSDAVSAADLGRINIELLAVQHQLTQASNE